MYNEATARLIREVPRLQGIEPEKLPELLTETYAAMAALRLRAPEAGSSDQKAMAKRKATLRRLAVVLGLYAAISIDSEKRNASAFVAASAYQLLHLANRVTGPETVERSIVSAKHVSSDLAAALLFLASGHPADAEEMAEAAIVPSTQDFRSTVAAAVRLLARGRLGPLRVTVLEQPDFASLEENAEFILWNKILACMRGLANRLTGEDPTANAGTANYLEVLQQVREESIVQIDADLGEGEYGIAYSAFSGPHHLATLLLATCRGLDETATIDIPPPAPVDAEKWQKFLAHRSRSKPYLWVNHAQAISDGLLDSGRSATISFPTGAGKSTLSEYKIACAVTAGKKVVYLAPTHALISQVTENLREALSGSVEASLVEEAHIADVEEPLSEDISVMTPERALLLATLYPEVFNEVGLIVFDECHLLHMDSTEFSRRPVDAMLSLLWLLKVAPVADVLLISAMMANGQELADWLVQSLGKDARHYGEGWKPTRQARGCVVYYKPDVTQVRDLANSHRRQGKNRPHSLMRITPFCLVGLKQTWLSDSPDDYKILPIVQEKAKLGLTSGWGLDAKKLGVAVQLASLSASRNLKTIVFVQDPRSIKGMCEKTGTPNGVRPIELNEDETDLLLAAATELGGREFAHTPSGVCGGHFGGMLTYERELVEKAFMRRDGLRILYATNTLAQGMNLPADQVVIAGSQRYDEDSGEQEKLKAHELLNAAGRAGRAGWASYGLVMLVPDRVITFEKSSGLPKGNDLRAIKNTIYSLDDRCLPIEDPLTTILDKVAPEKDHQHRLVDYLIQRLPNVAEGEDSPLERVDFLSKSLGAFRATAEEDKARIGRQLDWALKERTSMSAEVQNKEIDLFSTAVGVSPRVLDRMVVRIGGNGPSAQQGAISWAVWVVNWLIEDEEARRSLLPRYKFSLELARDSIALWMGGSTYRTIQQTLKPNEALGKLRDARRFVRNGINDIAYTVGLIGQTVSLTTLDDKDDIQASTASAAALVKEGFDTAEKLALYYRLRGHRFTRIDIHQRAETILRYLEPADLGFEDFNDTQRRVRSAVQRFMETERLQEKDMKPIRSVTL